MYNGKLLIMKNKVLFLIFCYNEENNIYFIKRLLSSLKNCFIINDGSTDNTLSKLNKITKNIYSNSKNLGKSASYVNFIKYINRRKIKFDYIILIDGDGQHTISDVKKILKSTMLFNIDLLIGKRDYTIKNMPKLRFFWNKFISWFISKKISQKLTDTQSGLRAIKYKLALKLSKKINSNRYEFETDVILKTKKENCNIKEISVKTLYKSEYFKFSINRLFKDLRRSIKIFLYAIKN